MSVISQMVTLAAAGSGGTNYFVGTYTYPSNLLLVDASYEPLDDYALANFHYSSATPRSLLLGVNLATGAVAFSTAASVNVDANYSWARNFNRGIDNAGVANYCCFGNYGNYGNGVAPIYKRGTGWVLRETNGTESYFSSVKCNGSIMSQIGRPVMFGTYSAYDTVKCYVACAYETNNSVSNKGRNGGSTNNTVTAVLPYSTNKLITIATYPSSWPVLYALTVDSNNAITGVSSQYFLTNYSSNSNDTYQFAYRAANDLLYVSFPTGIAAYNASTLQPHSTVTNVVFPSGVANPASAGTSGSDARLHYDSVNDCVYFSNNYYVMKLSADLATIHWAITGNFRNAVLYPKGDADGNLVFAALNNTSRTIGIIAQLDKDASQVSSTYTTPLAGVSWQRVTSGMSRNPVTCTVSSVTFFVQNINESNSTLSTSPVTASPTVAKKSL